MNFPASRSSLNYFIILLFVLAGSLFAIQLPDYKKMETRLEEEWSKKFPIKYKKVLKNNLAGKGILVYNTANERAYIYSFLVFVPFVEIREDELVEKEKGREIIVRLYYFPGREDSQFEIKLGQFIELQDRKRHRGWIRN